MSTKPFKDIEQMMKAAAEGYEQPFEEAAWRKMEVLLDGDKDRKKPVFWLWWLLPLFIGAGIGSYFIFNKTNEPGQSFDKPVPQPGKQQPVVTVSSPGDIASAAGQGTRKVLPASNNGDNATQAVIDDGSRTDVNAVPNQQEENNKYYPGRLNQNPPPGNTARKSLVSSKTSARVRVTAGNNTPVSNPRSEPVITVDNTIPALTGIVKNNPGLAVKPGGDNNPAGEKTATTASDSLVKPVSSQNKETGKQSRWYFIVAAGAEGSSPRAFSVEKISARAGITIGYQLDKNFSVQTGLFAGRKKYVAGPKDYKAKAGSYWSTVEIVEVGANCLVLEIPLDVRYDINLSKNTNVFTTAGLSSYIMSKEDYEYVYNRYGYLHFVEAGYKGNKHVLSVLRLSAGVEKKISKTLSLNAAPAFSIPLAGVGEGQVKLYSTEIMVGLKYQPLKKLKHK